MSAGESTTSRTAGDQDTGAADDVVWEVAPLRSVLRRAERVAAERWTTARAAVFGAVAIVVLIGGAAAVSLATTDKSLGALFFPLAAQEFDPASANTSGQDATDARDGVVAEETEPSASDPDPDAPPASTPETEPAGTVTEPIVRAPEQPQTPVEPLPSPSPTPAPDPSPTPTDPAPTPDGAAGEDDGLIGSILDLLLPGLLP